MSTTIVSVLYFTIKNPFFNQAAPSTHTPAVQLLVFHSRMVTVEGWTDLVCTPSPQAQLIAQSIGQAFSVAYQEFLRANGIDPEDLSQREYSDLLNTQDMYNDDLIHFSKSENCRDVSASQDHSARICCIVLLQATVRVKS